MTFFNEAAAALAGRSPRAGEDRWCVTHRLYRPDGSYLLHSKYVRPLRNGLEAGLRLSKQTPEFYRFGRSAGQVDPAQQSNRSDEQAYRTALRSRNEAENFHVTHGFETEPTNTWKTREAPGESGKIAANYPPIDAIESARTMAGGEHLFDRY